MDLARQSVQTIAAAVNTGTASALDIAEATLAKRFDAERRTLVSLV